MDGKWRGDDQYQELKCNNISLNLQKRAKNVNVALKMQLMKK